MQLVRDEGGDPDPGLWILSQTLTRSSKVSGTPTPALSRRSPRAMPMIMAPASQANPYVAPALSWSDDWAPPTKSLASQSEGVRFGSLTKGSRFSTQPAPIHRPV